MVVVVEVVGSSGADVAGGSSGLGLREKYRHSCRGCSTDPSCCRVGGVVVARVVVGGVEVGGAVVVGVGVGSSGG